MNNAEQPDFKFDNIILDNDLLEDPLLPPVSVLLADRAYLMLRTFDFIAVSHTCTAIARDAEDSERATKLMNRLNTDEGGLNAYIQQKSDISQTLSLKAREYFAKAIGHDLVDNAGLLSSEELDAMANYDFAEMEKQYFNIPSKHRTVDPSEANLTVSERKAKRKLRAQTKLEVTLARNQFVARLKQYLDSRHDHLSSSDTIE